MRYQNYGQGWDKGSLKDKRFSVIPAKSTRVIATPVLENIGVSIFVVNSVMMAIDLLNIGKRIGV